MLSDLVVKINEIIDETGVKLDIEQDGTIFIGPLIKRYDKSCS